MKLPGRLEKKLALYTLTAAMGLASPALANPRTDYRNARADLVRTVQSLETDSARALETARRRNGWRARPSREALQRLAMLRAQARDLRVEVYERDRRDARKEFHEVLQAYCQTVALYPALRPSRALDRDFDRIEQSIDRLSFYYNETGCRIDRDRASRGGYGDGRWGHDDHDRY